MEQMIKYEGKRNICEQFYKYCGQMHREMMDIVNTVIAPKLEGGNKTIRLMHFYYKAFDCGRHALHLTLDKKDGRVWITGHTGDMEVKTVVSSPLEDIRDRYLPIIIEEALYAITKEDDGICGLIDTDKYVYPKRFDYSTAR